MIFKGILLIISLAIINEVWTLDDKYTTLEDFGTVMNSSLIVILQENPKFLAKVVGDLISDLKAFFISNFGYNRLVLAQQVDKTLKELIALTPSKKLSKKDDTCISRNKNILYFLLREATMDWSCLENQVLHASKTLLTIYDKLMTLKDLPGSECNMGILCFATKGISGATLGATLSANLVDLGLTGADFFSAVRRCQKKIDSLKSAYVITIGNIKYCLSVNSTVN